jgi:cell division protein FtsW
MLLGVFFALILMQPNFSMAGSLTILVLVILFVGGMKFWHLFLLGASGAAGGWALLKAADYRVDRLTAFLDPWSDPLDTGYQLIQSLYALGSGGVFGMGFGQSRQKHLFIPHPETDFIFSIIGEEWGFIGAAILIMMFLFLIWRGITVALTAPDFFGCLLAAGITSLIAIQVIINIAVVTGSMPPTGLPLPFISFGGSSLLLFMGSIGVLLNISRHTASA